MSSCDRKLSKHREGDNDPGSGSDPRKFEPSLENLDAFHSRMHGYDCGCGGGGFEGFLGAQRTHSASRETHIVRSTSFPGTLDGFRNSLRRLDEWEPNLPHVRHSRRDIGGSSEAEHADRRHPNAPASYGERSEVQLIGAPAHLPRGSY